MISRTTCPGNRGRLNSVVRDLASFEADNADDEDDFNSRVVDRARELSTIAAAFESHRTFSDAYPKFRQAIETLESIAPEAFDYRREKSQSVAPRLANPRSDDDSLSERSLFDDIDE